MIAGHESVSSGQVLLNGKDVTHFYVSMAPQRCFRTMRFFHT
ncbi:hypothetical protein [Veronia pacifica]